MQSPFRLLAAHSFEQVLRNAFSECFLEDGTEALGLPDQMIPMAPERGVKSVDGGGDGLGRRDLQGTESALGVQSQRREAFGVVVHYWYAELPRPPPAFEVDPATLVWWEC